MGDQIGIAVSGELCFVPYDEFKRIRTLPIDDQRRADLFAGLCRINTLYMIARAGSGHIGSSFSSLDIMSWLLLNEVRPAESSVASESIFFSSKGHDVPGLYVAYIGLGKLDSNLLHKLRRLGGLPGHPDVGTPNMVTNTGSLGMGISKAKGIVLANRLAGRAANVFVLTGDGELQEGQFWESLISAANQNMRELTVIVDHNKVQSDELVQNVSDLGDIGAKLTAFGWHVSRCDGHDMAALAQTIRVGYEIEDKPKIIIADTVKGKGVSFMEHTSCNLESELYRYHSGAPDADEYNRAVAELIDFVNVGLEDVDAGPLALEHVLRAKPAASETAERLVEAYSRALVDLARADRRIVALDGDLVLDTGLIPFRRAFPDRFVECGIAEQDMVSQAGGMALQGLIPIVHSFACFLSARPNEQIYNNASERTKIIYVGSLAGVLPGGPGHSHQAVRDISALSAVPGLVLVEPSCSAEVGPLLQWCVDEAEGSSYLRLSSVAVAVKFVLPSDYRPTLGQGVALKGGQDVVVFAYGPVLLSAAIEAALLAEREHGISVKVVNLPWLNFIDVHWFSSEVRGFKAVLSLDEHYAIGGQGDRLAEVFCQIKAVGQGWRRVAIQDFPVCGGSDEVLCAHGLDSRSLCDVLTSLVSDSQARMC